jgi:magnesium transporter
MGGATVLRRARDAGGASIIGRLLRRGGKSRGSAPGTLVHTGPRRVEHVRIHRMEYGPDHLEESDSDTWDGPLRHDDAHPVVWIDVDGLHDTDLLGSIAGSAQLHPLVLEDVFSVGQRAKVEDYGSYLYIVLRMLAPDANGGIAEEQVSLVLGDGFVLSFQEGAGDVFDPVRHRLRDSKGQLRTRGSDYLAYTLIDAVVDGYFTVLESLGEHIDALEVDVIEAPGRDTVGRIYELKRELLLMRRAVWPLRDVLNSMVRDVSGPITPETRVFLRDAYDHTVQVMDTVEILRDMLASMMDMYLSSVSNRMNEVMKVLTVIATIFIPLTFIVGVYGMNFDYMPELHWRWSYPLLWLLMIGVVAVMVAMFRRRNWI